jgi:hypothetical protein
MNRGRVQRAQGRASLRSFQVRARWFHPLGTPCGCREGLSEVLRFVNYLAVAEFHNAHCVCRLPLVRDRIFRDPEIPVSENAPNVKAGRLSRMMTPQGLQIASPKDSFARLGIITNSVVMINIVFRVCIADCRRVPVRICSSCMDCPRCGFAFMPTYFVR